MKKIFPSMILAGLLGFSALQAESVQARFHLPVAAHLGVASLAPGDYRISLIEEMSGSKHVLIEGKNGFAYGIPMPVEKDAPSGRSSLELVESQGNYFIKEYRSGYTGRVYAFAIPHNLRNTKTQVVEITN